ncbi:hypothetical protein OG864_45140 [Streptomyces sp. NBC_00124]|uniref:hypothetical protein n=1 Tax=Streptomyces sp. NBC_00124 TaxID=2975662 RepID=UPI0022514F56|nr:hypothetical protein [Streptomyces sp. NBC_00124]MCX5365888.1 hypothetical protein [Streptomyces sp. NBC_00124]
MTENPTARLLDCGFCYEEQGEEVHPHPECPIGQVASPAAVSVAGQTLLGAAEIETRPDLNVTPLTDDQLAADEEVERTGRPALLTEAERTMLTYALDQAQEHIWSRDGFTDEDQAAVTSLRRLAAEAPAPETQTEAFGKRETIEYFLQAQQDDGTWEDASSYMNALDWATERLAGKRAHYPDFTWRMAQRITTVTVQPVPDCSACRHWRCDGDGPCGALLDAWQRCTCTGPAAVSAGVQPDEEADRVVAYRSDGGRLLRCLRHVPPPAARHADFHPVTSEDLPDGGVCTYPDCGADVLIPPQSDEEA